MIEVCTENNCITAPMCVCVCVQVCVSEHTATMWHTQDLSWWGYWFARLTGFGLMFEWQFWKLSL